MKPDKVGLFPFKVLPSLLEQSSKGKTKSAFVGYLVKKEMRSFLFILAVILLIGWGIGIFVYALKGLFNIVIILAAIAFIMAIFNKPSKT